MGNNAICRFVADLHRKGLSFAEINRHVDHECPTAFCRPGLIDMVLATLVFECGCTEDEAGDLVENWFEESAFNRRSRR